MGGSQSQEFMVYTEAGEDLIVSCAESGYAANLEKAVSQLTPVTEMEPTGDGMPEPVHTPGCAAIADVAEFFKISPASDIKTVAYMGKKKDGTGKTIEVPIIAFLRGDHFVNETKLMAVAHVTELRTMVAEELALYFEGPAGYLGPIGLKVLPVAKGDLRAATVILDKGLEGRRNLVSGANKLDYHYRNIVPERDFTWTTVAATEGKSYALHPSIAPFQVVVTITNVGDAALLAAGEKVAAALEAAGVYVVLDDRDERAGVKFKDADLVGIPYRINIGRGVAEGKVE